MDAWQTCLKEKTIKHVPLGKNYKTCCRKEIEESHLYAVRLSSSEYISSSRLTSFSLSVYFRLGDFEHVFFSKVISSYIDFHTEK